jgi:hypothetical protein
MSDAVLDIFRKAKKEIPDIRYVLPGSGKEVLLRPFTTKEQKGVLKALEKEDQVLVGEALDSLLSNCILNGIKVDELFTKDRECLLINLRKESVKEDFKHLWTCEECNEKNTLTKDLGQLSIKELPSDAIKTKTIDLIDRKDIKLVLGLTTRAEEKKIISYTKKQTKNNDSMSQAELLNAAFAAAIKEIIYINEKGEEQKMAVSFDDRIKLIEEMSIDDKTQIQKFFESLSDYGYDMKIGSQTCKGCQHEQEVELEWMGFFIM